jgi:hypothetical protein
MLDIEKLSGEELDIVQARYEQIRQSASAGREDAETYALGVMSYPLKCAIPQ